MLARLVALTAILSNASPGRTSPGPPSEAAAVPEVEAPDSALVYELPEIQVEADRWAPQHEALPMATSIIDAKTIASSGALNVGDVLRPVVGVRVASLGGVGSMTPISIRGSSSDQVLVLIDGRRLNSAQGGGVDLSDLPLENIQRIEVLRGGASALFGPVAIGGVVNLITKDSESRESADLKAEIGSFGTELLSGRLTGGSPAAAFRASGKLLLSQGRYDYVEAPGLEVKRENGAFDSRFLDGEMSFKPRWASRFDMRGSHYQAEKGIPGATQFPSPTAVQRDERSALDFEIKAIRPGTSDVVLSGKRIATSLSGFAQRQIRRYADPDYPLGPIDDVHENESFGFSATQIRSLGAAGTAYAGVEYREDHLTSTLDGRRARPVRAFHLRDVFRLSGSVELTPALRYDRPGEFGGQWCPKLLGRAVIGSSLEIRAAAGRSFRPPSFDDLFLPPRASAAGNPDLQPERAVDADLGLSLSRGAWAAGATFFTNRITDLIQWQPGASGLWRPHNVDGARLTGLEVEARGSIPAAFLGGAVWCEANYTFLDPRDSSDDPNTGGKVLVYRPRHRANLQFRVTSGRWSSETQWRYTGPVFTTRANTKELPGYLTADVLLRWRAGRNASLALHSLNLTGEQYQDFRDFPVPGRQWRLAGSLSFGRPS